MKHLPLALFSLVVLTGCQGTLGQFLPFQSLKPLPQDPFIQVYMNHNPVQKYVEPYRQIEREGDNLEAEIIKAIQNATTTIDIAVQEINLPNIAHALVKQHQAGVKVRVIIENQYNRSWGNLTPAQVQQLESSDRNKYQEFAQLADQDQNGQLSPAEMNQSDVLLILRNAGIPLMDDTADGSKGSGLMHHKFMIVDQQIVVTGSANWTTSGIHGDFFNPESRGNANNLLMIQDQKVAQIFTEEFKRMWGDGVGGQPDSLFGLQKPPHSPQMVTVGETTVKIKFSPNSPTQPWETSSNGLISQTLQTATDSINLALFVFSEQRIVDTLQTKHQQGVTIKALIDPSFAFRNYSEGLDMLGVNLLQKCRDEANNRPWVSPITTMGIPQLPQGDKLHHKFAVMDENTVITGSHNWSAAANDTNDEAVLTLRNPVIAAHYEREFKRLYQNAALGIPDRIQERIEQEKQKCGV